MNRILFALLLAFFAMRAEAQLMTVDFENSVPEKIQGVQIRGEAGFIEGVCQSGNHSLIMAGNSAITITKESARGMGMVSFDYSVKNINGKGFSLNISYKTKADQSYKEAASNVQNSNKSTCFPKTIDFSTLERNDISSVTIEIADYNSGELVIDNIRVYELEKSVYNKNIRNQREANYQEMEGAIINSIEQKNFRNFEKTATKLEERYYNEVKTIANLYNYLGHMEITTGIYDVFFIRNKMANPIGYSEFNNFFSSISQYSDLAQQDYLKDLKRAFERQKSQYQVDSIRKFSKIGKIIGFAANVGNILSGGKLNSIINSFKGIMVNTFSQSNIMAKINPYVETSFLSRDKQTITALMPDSQKMQQVQKIVSEGRNKFKDFSGFFSIIEQEYDLLDNSADDWRNANQEMQGLGKGCEDLLSDYLGLIKPEYRNDKEFQAKILDNDPDAMRQFQSDIKIYFRKIKNIDTYRSSQSDIENVGENLEKVDDLLENYKVATSKFRDLLVDMKSDIETRENPWTKYMKENKRPNVFNSAEQAWENVKKALLAKDKLPAIISKIEDTYLSVNMRNVR